TSHHYRFRDWPADICGFEIDRNGSSLPWGNFARPIPYRCATARRVDVLDDQQLVSCICENIIMLNNRAEADLPEVECRFGKLNARPSISREGGALRLAPKPAHEHKERKQ